MSSIFISIVSQDEVLLRQTVESAIKNCSSKNQLHFGIIEQSSNFKFSDLQGLGNISLVKINSGPRGVGIARKESIDLYSGEDYILVIDSHTVFEKYWDENLIRRLNFIEKKEGRKSIISQRLFGGELVNNCMTSERFPQAFTLTFDGLIIKNFKKVKGDYQEHYAVSCHFIFCRPEPLLEVGFDPRIYYLAEEPMISMRLCTRGYRIFSIDYVPMVSLNKVDLNISDGWRNKIDYYRMSEDFSILINTINDRMVGRWAAESEMALESFINNSHMNIEVPFIKLGLEISQHSIEKIKNKIVEIFSQNDFNSSILEIIKISSDDGV